MGTLLVASTGGHLVELYRLLPRLTGLKGDRTWVTNDSPQSRVLLRGEDVILVPYQASRQLWSTMRNLARARHVLRRRGYETTVSTGSAVALGFLPVAAAHGSTCHYIESATRVRSPSITGRLLATCPGIHCYTQHPRWAGGRWHYEGSVLDGFASAPRPTASVRRVAVTLGTWKQGFEALVRRLVEILPSDVEVTWQTGYTDVHDVPIAAHPWFEPTQLASVLRSADVVVTHAGMGATLDALEAGKLPVVVPRRRAAGEQVDDHQLELADELARRGLALARPVPELTYDDLVAAAGCGVRRAAEPPPFHLRPPSPRSVAST